MVGSVQPGATVNAGLRSMVKDQRSARLQSIMGLAAVARQAGHEERLVSGLCGSRPGPTLSDGEDARAGRACPQPPRTCQRGDRRADPGTAGRPVPTRRPSVPTEPASFGIALPCADGFPGIVGGQESTETRDSLRWLIDRRPDLRNELTNGLVDVLIFGMGDFDEAARALSATIAAADLESLARPGQPGLARRRSLASEEHHGPGGRASREPGRVRPPRPRRCTRSSRRISSSVATRPISKAYLGLWTGALTTAGRSRWLRRQLHLEHADDEHEPEVVGHVRVSASESMPGCVAARRTPDRVHEARGGGSRRPAG